jgi:DNA mismatch endonuclease (patch repair protein)
LTLRSHLHGLGLRFLVDAAPAGTDRRRRADVVIRGSRIAVLVHGCFWHSCPLHLHLPHSNHQWWVLKLLSIRESDADRLVELTAADWLPYVVWEHEDMAEAALAIYRLDGERRQR